MRYKIGNQIDLRFNRLKALKFWHDFYTNM